MDNTLKSILETQLIGVCRVALTLPLEHSLDRLKTHVQQKLQPTSLFSSVLEVKKQHGLLKGLFQGFQPNLIRCIIKQYYRWPMMILIPNFFTNTVGVNQPILCKTLTGISIGIFESFIICPLERLKCYRMTQVALQGIKQSITVRPDLIQFLYTGYQMQAARQIVSWVTYLFWDHKIRYAFKGTRDQALTYPQIIATSFLTSILNIAFVHPFDTMKTLFQMQNNSKYVEMKFFESMKFTYDTVGLRGLYAGWQMRIMAFFAQALLTTPTIDYLERKYGKF